MYGCWNDYRMIQSVICPLLRSSLANSLLLWRNCSSNMLIRLLTPCVCCSDQATTTNMYTGNGKMRTTNMKDIRLPTIGFLSQTMNALLRRITVDTINIEEGQRLCSTYRRRTRMRHRLHLGFPVSGGQAKLFVVTYFLRPICELDISLGIFYNRNLIHRLNHTHV